MKKQKKSKRYLLAILLITVLAASIVQPPVIAQADQAGLAAMITWNARTPQTLIAVTQETFRQLCITLWIESKLNTDRLNRLLDRARVRESMRLPQLPPSMCWFMGSRHSNQQ